MVTLAFLIALISILTLGGLFVGTIAFKTFRAWPPPQKKSWQYRTVWTLFRIGILGTIAVTILHWNTYSFDGAYRFWVGLSLLLVGFGAAFYAYFFLGLENTHGLKTGLITNGPYKYSRNPQYVTAIVGFVGLAVVSNSFLVGILCALIILVYVLFPFAEEPWLLENYGDDYALYKSMTPRFVGFVKQKT